MKWIHILFVIIYLSGGDSVSQWIQTSYPSGGQITCIVSKENNLFVGNNFQGVSLSTDNGNNWTTVNNGLTTLNVHDLLVKDSLIFVGTYKGGVFLSSDNGSNWVTVNNGLANLKVYHLTQASSIIFAGTEGSGIFRTSDNGDNWLFSGLPGEIIWDLCSDGSNILAATADHGIFLSTDNGNSWQAINNGLPQSSIIAVEINDSKFFAGTPYNGPYLSTDHGANWFSINNGISAPAIWGFEFLSPNIFLNCSGGVYFSTDLGSSWTDISNGLSDPGILTLYIKDDYIYAGSGNSGIVFRRPISEIISNIEIEEESPSNFILNQNYPNPFNPGTKIRFVIPASSLNPFSKGEGTLVTLKVYDVLGNEVATLVNEEKPAGTYEVEFNPESINKNPASGIYFYQLKAGSFIETKKMILLK